MEPSAENTASPAAEVSTTAWAACGSVAQPTTRDFIAEAKSISLAWSGGFRD